MARISDNCLLHGVTVKNHVAIRDRLQICIAIQLIFCAKANLLTSFNQDYDPINHDCTVRYADLFELLLCELLRSEQASERVINYLLAEE